MNFRTCALPDCALKQVWFLTGIFASCYHAQGGVSSVFCVFGSDMHATSVCFGSQGHDFRACSGSNRCVFFHYTFPDHWSMRTLVRALRREGARAAPSGALPWELLRTLTDFGPLQRKQGLRHVESIIEDIVKSSIVDIVQILHLGPQCFCLVPSVPWSHCSKMFRTAWALSLFAHCIDWATS